MIHLVSLWGGLEGVDDQERDIEGLREEGRHETWATVLPFFCLL